MEQNTGPLLHSTPTHASLPAAFVLAAGNLPPASSSAAASLPVVDLSLPRDEARRAVLAAGRDIGFFQVVNHGVPAETMRAMEELCSEFFRLPVSEPGKAALLSEDKKRPNRLFSGVTYDTGGQKSSTGATASASPALSPSTLTWSPNGPTSPMASGP